MSPSRQAQHQRVHRWLWAALDAAIWPSSVFVAVWLRYELQVGPVFAGVILATAIVAATTHLVVGAWIGPYAVSHERASFEETRDVGRTVVVTGLVVTVVAFSPPFLYDVPRSVPFTATAFAMVGMFACRFIIRSWRTRHYEANGGAKRVLVFGAGEAGSRLTRSLLRDPHSGYHPVALLDDDRTKARLRVEGVKVCGDRHAMAAVADKYDAQTIILALPVAKASTIPGAHRARHRSGSGRPCAAAHHRDHRWATDSRRPA